MLTLSDYDKAISLLLGHIGTRQDVVTAWQYGEVSQPGVSDLDLIVLIKDKCEPDLVDYLRKDRLPPLLLEAMAHANLMVVPERTANGVFFWDSIRCKDLTTGNAVPLPLFSITHRQLAMFIDWFFERCFRIYSMHLLGCANKQLMLGMMKSFCYSVDAFSEFGPPIDLTDYRILKERVTALRNEWLTLDLSTRDRKLSELFSDFFRFVRGLHREVFNWAGSLAAYPDWPESDREPVFFRYPDGNTFKFSPEFDEEIGSADGKPVVSVPIRLLNHFSIYTSFDCPLSKRLSTGFGASCDRVAAGRVSLSGPYGEFLAKRFNFAADWYEKLSANGFNYGMFKFGWYLMVR